VDNTKQAGESIALCHGPFLSGRTALFNPNPV